ncbi:helix-turn-helix domain-containing protein [Mycoplasmatota bacterium]|nr:helix-turn-helix domain-containing protein [Mycoplasmatota bacterium]
MNAKKTGKFIQELRKAKKLTQNDLADLLQITNKAVSRWETGEGFPDIVLLPRLSEVLGVTIDDILKGEQIEKVERRNDLDKQKLKNIYMICLAIISLSFVLFLGLTYTTLKVWIGFMAYVIPATLALVWILIARSNYMINCTYDENDQKILFNTLRTSIILYVVLFVIMLAQVLMLSSDNILTLFSAEYFILISLVAGVLVFLGLFWYFYSIDVNRNTNKLGLYKKITTYFVIIAIVALPIFPIIVPNNWNSIILLIPVEFILIYMFFGIYYLIKKTESLKMFSLRLVLILVSIFIYTPESFIGGDSAFVQVLPEFIYFSVLLMSIVGFIYKFVHSTNDALYNIYFQNIFFLIVIFFYNFGSIIVIIIISILGTLDIYFNKKISAKSVVNLNQK